MRLLVDTHAFPWWLSEESSLSDTARRGREDPANELLFSAAAAWEITTKHRLGRLPFAGDIPERLEWYVAECGMTELPVSLRHAAEAGRLVLAYKDPFDRLLIAQAMLEGAGIVTADGAIRASGVPTLW